MCDPSPPASVCDRRPCGRADLEFVSRPATCPLCDLGEFLDLSEPVFMAIQRSEYNTYPCWGFHEKIHRARLSQSCSLTVAACCTAEVAVKDRESTRPLGTHRAPTSPQRHQGRSTTLSLASALTPFASGRGYPGPDPRSAGRCASPRTPTQTETPCGWEQDCGGLCGESPAAPQKRDCTSRVRIWSVAPVTHALSRDPSADVCSEAEPCLLGRGVLGTRSRGSSRRVGGNFAVTARRCPRGPAPTGYRHWLGGHSSGSQEPGQPATTPC